METGISESDSVSAKTIIEKLDFILKNVMKQYEISPTETFQKSIDHLNALLNICEFSDIEDYFGFDVFIDEVNRNIKEVYEIVLANKIDDTLKFSRFLERELSKNPFCSYEIISNGSNMTENDIEGLNDYLKIGKELCNDPIIFDINENLKNLRSPNFAASKYAAIIGPSFMGKTQSAFSLSYLRNVIYVNLYAPDAEEVILQSIYHDFKWFSTLFQTSIDIDRSVLMYSASKKRARDFKTFTYKMLTPGLIFTLIKSRILNKDLEIGEWFQKITLIKNCIIPKMTVKEFESFTEDLNFDQDHLIFIDELPFGDQNIAARIQFLRNFCRAVNIPSILSGTNSKVRNLIGAADARYSGRKDLTIDTMKPWVKIITKLPKSNLRSSACVTKFKDISGEERLLAEFMSTSNPTELDIPLLFETIYPYSKEQNSLESIKKLIVFIIEQIKTCLTGIANIILNRLTDKMSIIDDAAALWKDLNSHLIERITNRKIVLQRKPSIMSSLHILIFPSLGTIKVQEETGPAAAAKVESHLFYYGTRNDSIFELGYDCQDPSSDANNDMIFFRNETKYEDKCYFPELNEDFFTTFAVWNIWHERKMNQTYTIAHEFAEYLELKDNYRVGVDPKVADSFALELLAHFSICYASHSDMSGNTDGLSLFKEFIRNLQNIKLDTGRFNVPKKMIWPFEADSDKVFPSSLKNFLSKISVPYLVRFPDDFNIKESLKSALFPFVKLGESKLTRTSIGWEVLFDIYYNGTPQTGFIECKLWNRPIGFGKILKYYKRACEMSSPLTFLICHKIQKAIFQGKMKPKIDKTDLIDGKDAAEIGRTVKKLKVDYFCNFEDLWKDEMNCIDIYAVKYEEKPGQDGKFFISTIKSFENPNGVFIIVESSFDPQFRTSRN